MTKWISVDEYLPPFHEHVIIYAPNGEMGHPDLCIGYLEHDADFYYFIGKEDITIRDPSEIKYWMRLPELPND